MKFSIIIPVYNAEKYLSDAIESVISQKDIDFEIIIVDDGSIDGSERIYERYIDQYPKHIVSIKQENSGQLISRSRGILKSSGDYCLFLDSDDILVENCLKELMEYIEVYQMPEIVVFPFYYDRNGKLEKSRMLSDQDTLYEGEGLKNVYKEVFEGILLNSVCTKAVRRDIAISSSKGHEKYGCLRCAEDRYHSMMMIKDSRRILYITKPYYRYRIVNGSTTRNFSYDAIDRFNISSIYNVELQCLREWGMDSEEWREKLLAKWFEYPLYVLDRFYNNVSKRVRKRVLHYPWEQFLPKEIDIQISQSNHYINKTQKSLWKWIIHKNYTCLQMHFIKKNIYNLLRRIKKKVIKMNMV